MNPQDSQIHFCAVVVSLMPDSLPQMHADRPGPGEELNPSGEAATPREAASVIVLRGGADALEVLLVRRTPKARFMGGVWVFPGGAVDEGEDERDAAARELLEEAAVTVADPGALVRFSRWITPAEVKIRFDTHFFLAPLPEGPSRPSTAPRSSTSAGSRQARRWRPTRAGSSSSSSRPSSTSSNWRTSTR